MSNFSQNDGQANQPGSYPPNYVSTKPDQFHNQYSGPASAPEQLIQQQPMDPKQKEMLEFINYKFSPEEIRVMKQCEIDSLMKRSLPIGFGLGFSTFWAIQKGVIKTGKFGAWPSILGASVLGYLIGRFSYIKVCQQRIMDLPNSQFAEMLRKRSRNLAEESYATDAGFATASTLAPLQTDDFNRPNSMNLDTNRPYDDTDDHYVPTREGTNDLNEDLNIPTHKNVVSYDELRQKNRDNFNKSHGPAPGFSYSRPPAHMPAPAAAELRATPTNVPIASAQPDPFAENDRRRANLRTNSINGNNKNQYGDIWNE